jgi:hypothetical protein
MTLEEFYKICDSIQEDEYGCKLYPGATLGFHFRIYPKGLKGKAVRVHRLILERKLGRPIYPGYWAIHSCDEPSCVNPDHLREGTHSDNARDSFLRNPNTRANLMQANAERARKAREYPKKS